MGISSILTNSYNVLSENFEETPERNSKLKGRQILLKLLKAMTLDVKLLYFLYNFAGKSLLFDTLTVFLASYLQYFLVAIFLRLLYFSAYSKRKKLYLFWTTTISMMVAYLGITEIIRFFYHRPRPFITYNDTCFKPVSLAEVVRRWHGGLTFFLRMRSIPKEGIADSAALSIFFYTVF